MMTIQQIRSQRIAAEVPAIALATKARVNRAKLSAFERGHFQPTDDELERLTTALRELIQARETVREAPVLAGWPGLVA